MHFFAEAVDFFFLLVVLVFGCFPLVAMFVLAQCSDGGGRWSTLLTLNTGKSTSPGLWVGSDTIDSTQAKAENAALDNANARSSVKPKVEYRDVYSMESITLELCVLLRGNLYLRMKMMLMTGNIDITKFAIVTGMHIPRNAWRQVELMLTVPIVLRH